MPHCMLRSDSNWTDLEVPFVHFAIPYTTMLYFLSEDLSEAREPFCVRGDWEPDSEISGSPPCIMVAYVHCTETGFAAFGCRVLELHHSTICQLANCGHAPMSMSILCDLKARDKESKTQWCHRCTSHCLFHSPFHCWPHPHCKKYICYFNHCLVIWIATYGHGFMYSNNATTVVKV